MQFIMADMIKNSASLVLDCKLIVEYKGYTYTGVVNNAEFTGTCKNRQGVVVASGVFSTNGFEIIDVHIGNTHVQLVNGELRGTTIVKYLDENINCICTLKNEDVGLCIKSVYGNNDKYSISGTVDIADTITFKYGTVCPFNTDIERIVYNENETIIKYRNGDTFTGIVNNLNKVSGKYEKLNVTYIGVFDNNICNGTRNGISGNFDINHLYPINVTINSGNLTVPVNCFGSTINCVCELVDNNIVKASGELDDNIVICTEPILTDNVLTFGKHRIICKNYRIKEIIAYADHTVIIHDDTSKPLLNYNTVTRNWSFRERQFIQDLDIASTTYTI